MIRTNIVKWLAAGVIALAAVPAVSMARHTSHVSAASTPIMLAALTSATPIATHHHSHKALHHRSHKTRRALHARHHKASHLSHRVR